MGRDEVYQINVSRTVLNLITETSAWRSLNPHVILLDRTLTDFLEDCTIRKTNKGCQKGIFEDEEVGRTDRDRSEIIMLPSSIFYWSPTKSIRLLSFIPSSLQYEEENLSRCSYAVLKTISGNNLFVRLSIACFDFYPIRVPACVFYDAPLPPSTHIKYDW